MEEGVRFPDEMFEKSTVTLADQILIADSADSKKAKWYSFTTVYNWISGLFAHKDASNITGTTLEDWQETLKIAAFTDRVFDASGLNVYNLVDNGYYKVDQNTSNLPGTTHDGIIELVNDGDQIFMKYHEYAGGVTTVYINHYNGSSWDGWQTNPVINGLLQSVYVNSYLGSRLSPVGSEYGYQISSTLNKEIGYRAINTNTSGNAAVAAFEAKGAGADYTHNIYMSYFNTAYYVSQLQERGILGSDHSIAIASIGTSLTTDFYLGDAITSLVKYFSVVKYGYSGRKVPRIQSVTSAATVTPNIDNDDVVNITAQAVGLTIANPTGTPQNKQVLMIDIIDNNSAQTIAFGNKYAAGGVDLPTTTTSTKQMSLVFVYDSIADKYKLRSLAQE